MTSIEELESISTAARQKKGRMDAQAKSQTVDLLAKLWKDPNVDPRQILELLEPLHYDALADGIAAAWNDMTSDRRSLFRQWLPAPVTERDARRMASVAASVIEKDSHAALDWLDRIVASEKGRMNKEVRHILAATVLGAKGGRLRNLTIEAAHAQKSLRVFSALLDVAAEKDEKVALGRRYELVEGVLRLLSDANVRNERGITETLDRIPTEIRSWPKELREQFRRQAVGIEPTLLETFFESGTTSQPGPLPSPPPSTTPTASVDHKAVIDALDRRITELRAELDMLVDLRAMLADLQTKLASVDDQRKVWGAEQTRLNAEIEESNKNLCRLDNNAKELARQLGESQRQTENLRVNAEHQRAELLHQIEANSKGRIEEFKTSLGLTLSKLVQDLPHQDKELSQAAARVLLLQFHQFLEMLEEKGIRVRPAKGTGA